MIKQYNVLMLIVTIFGLFFLLIIFENKINFKINKDAPQLSNIGPHRKFIDEKTCLGCHQNGLNIPNVGFAKKIPHEFRKNCVNCHILPI